MKSCVTLEQHVCIVCGKPFDTGALLLDRGLREKFEHTTVTGNGLCPDDKKKFDEGYIALVGVNPSKSGGVGTAGAALKPEDAYRTGELAHIKREAFARVFDVPAPEGPMAFCDSEVIKKLSAMVAQ